MFLKCSVRRKNGKDHRSWSIVESRRHAGGKVAQRHVLYLGEINDSQQLAWERTIAVFDEHPSALRQLSLFPADRTPPAVDGVTALQVRLDALRLEQPRQWGACWLADALWRELKLDELKRQNKQRADTLASLRSPAALDSRVKVLRLNLAPPSRSQILQLPEWAPVPANPSPAAGPGRRSAARTRPHGSRGNHKSQSP